jgi:hypothetical protein
LPVPGGILVVEFDAEGGMSVRDERQEVVEFSAERQGAAEAALAAAAAAAANGDVGGNGCAAGEGADGCRGADEASAPAASRRVKGKDEFEEGDRVEAKYGTAEDELWWPATVTKLWTNGDVGVLYDDGDAEPQKAASRVRHMRGAAAHAQKGGPDADLVLRHARHSHAAFLVGKASAAAMMASAGEGDAGLKGAARDGVDPLRALPKGVRLAMFEEGLFGKRSDGSLQKSHVHVHWLCKQANPTAPGTGASGAATAAGSAIAASASAALAAAAAAAAAGTFGMQYDYSRSAATDRLLCAVEMAPAGWDERGCPLFALAPGEAERVRRAAHEAALVAAAEEERQREERVAADIARRGKQVMEMEQSVEGGRKRRAATRA